jgi:methionine-S-sulfoxide reductase
MNTETAILAGGCFWGVEELVRKLQGIVETKVGYTGGETDNPTYADVKAGQTGHAEAVKIIFDPSVTSYEEILRFFFKMHDPTTKDQQGNDVGTQYRSAIFYTSEEQKTAAEKVTDMVRTSGKWNDPLVTQILPAQKFWDAEEYHQKYLVKHHGGYTCHFIRAFTF